MGKAGPRPAQAWVVCGKSPQHGVSVIRMDLASPRCPHCRGGGATSVSVCPGQVSPEMQQHVLRRLFQTDPDIIKYLLRRRPCAAL